MNKTVSNSKFKLGSTVRCRFQAEALILIVKVLAQPAASSGIGLRLVSLLVIHFRLGRTQYGEVISQVSFLWEIVFRPTDLS